MAFFLFTAVPANPYKKLYQKAPAHILTGKFVVWLRQKRLKSVRIPASFFRARQKIFLAILHTTTY